jgi:uncharacterized glyoxalase superfamily protein PhnB
MRRYLFVAVFAAAYVAPVLGAEKEQRHHDAHEHGAAELNLAWEGNTVTVEFESPAVNIVGFEHQPRNDAQKQSVQDALATLRNADKLFAFTPAAGCRGQATEVETDLSKPQASEHSEFRANYRYTCEKPEALTSVDILLFKLFPKTHKLRAQVVSATGQTATELGPKQTRLSLR